MLFLDYHAVVTLFCIHVSRICFVDVLVVSSQSEAQNSYTAQTHTMCPATDNPTRCEIRAVIHMNAAAIHHELSMVYGQNVTIRQ
jgi:hypothetical protein